MTLCGAAVPATCVPCHATLLSLTRVTMIAARKQDTTTLMPRQAAPWQDRRRFSNTLKGVIRGYHMCSQALGVILQVSSSVQVEVDIM